jgi:hypothetical protein
MTEKQTRVWAFEMAMKIMEVGGSSRDVPSIMANAREIFNEVFGDKS